MKTKEQIKETYGTESYYAYKEGYEEGYVESINSLRNQAAIAAMQGFLSRETYRADLKTLAKDSVRLANYLIEELKNKSV